MKKQLLILMTLCTTVIGYSQTIGDTFVDSYISYEITSITNNTVKTIDYDIAGGSSVNIPATLDYNSVTYNVTAVGVSSFLSNNLTSVTFTLPSNITSIGQNGFKNNQLSAFNIPNSVTSIGNSAFNNNDLSNITIPDSVTYIGNSAFSVNELVTVSIPNNITSLGNFTFWNNHLETVTIPSSVMSIGTYVFADNNLTDVYALGTTPPTISTGGSTDTFGVTQRANIHLHIPGGTAVMDAYVNDSGALWTGFNPVTQDALGVSDFELNNNVNIITANNQISVTYNNSIRLKNYTLYSITGAKVKEGAESTVNIESLSNGIYLLKLDFDKGIVVRKIAK